MMKKATAILLSLVLVLALSACAVNTGGSTNNPDKNAPVSVPDSSAQSTPSENAASQTAQPTNSTTRKSTSSQTERPTNSTTQKSTALQTERPTNSATSQPSKDLLTRDRAIELALQKAGLKRENVRDLEAELDRERGGVIWEVDFEAAGYEYSCDINAETGAIVKYYRDRED